MPQSHVAARPSSDQTHIEPTYSEDLGPSASDVTPGRTNQTPGNDPSTKE